MADLNAALSIVTGFTDKVKPYTEVIGQMEKLNKVAGNVVKQFEKSISAVEGYVKLNAKLGLMTDSLEEHSNLQDKIFSSANKARTSYADMVNTVTKLGLSTGNLFDSNEEVVSFSELLQKSVVASGTSEDKQPAVLQQTANAMASGSMGSGDLMSIAQNAPVMYEAIAEFTGKSGNELLDMADKGDITAELIKNAMFGMKTEIENQFSEMPLTFTDIMNRVKNAGTDAFGNLFIAINDLLTSQGVVDFFNIITEAIYFAGEAIDYVVGLITQYSPIIESVLMAIGALLMANLINFLPTIISYLITAIPLLLNQLAILWLTNAPLIILIVTIAAVIYMLRTMGEEIMGFIGGVIGFVLALIMNLFFATTQVVFGIIEYWVNLFVSFANFFGNLFNDPIGSIIHLFADLADGVLGVLEKIASGIDFVFGSNFADTIKGWRADLKVFADTKAKEYGNGTYEEKVPSLDINEQLNKMGISMERANYEDSTNIGKGIGGEFGSDLEKLLGGKDGSTRGTDSGGNNYTNVFDVTNMPDLTNTKDVTNTKDTTNNNSKDLDLMIENIFSSENNSNGEEWGMSPSNTTDLDINFDTSALEGYDYNQGINNTINSISYSTGDSPISVEGTGSGGAVNVDMPDEDLDYLREIAERDYIANIATNSLAPNISVQFGDVHESADANQVAGRIKQILQEEIAMVSEGVY